MFSTKQHLVLFVELFLILLQQNSLLADDHYSWDFTTEYFDNISLAPHGKAAIKLLQPQKDGLHIIIPNKQEIPFSGFTPRFQVKGDFKITLSWSIKRLREPESGYGSGPSLYLTTEGEHQPAASLSRLIRADGKSVYSIFVAREVEGNRKVSVRLFDTQANSGSLRIIRKGETLGFAVSDSDSKSKYKVLDEQDFTDGTLNLLRAGLQQSDSSTSSEIILSWFSVYAADLPQLPSEQDRTEPLYASRYNPQPAPVSYAWIWKSIIALCFAAGTIFWLAKRRK